jgi:hypothetical protein
MLGLYSLSRTHVRLADLRTVDGVKE